MPNDEADGQYEALISVAAQRITVVLLSGDSRTTAAAGAKSLGFNEVEADVLPDPAGL